MRRRIRIVTAVQRLALRSARTPLARVWSPPYRAVRWLAVLALTGGRRDAAAYGRASMGASDFLPGLSDIDVAVILSPDPAAPGLARTRAEHRWRWARRLIGRFVDRPRIYEEPELRAVAGRSALTYGLEDGAAAFFGPGFAEHRIRMLERPGVFGTGDWRLLRGPDRRPPARDDPQEQRIGAWLELVQWWQWAYAACIEPPDLHRAHLCLKLVAEPARIWLWLAHGERPASRGDVLERALALMPEEEAALRAALELRRVLPRSPEPPLRDTLPVLARLTARIAAVMADQVGEAGATEVRLLGSDPLPPHRPWRPAPALEGGEAPAALPLCDWRALVRPALPDDAFAPLPGDPCDPDVLAAAVTAQTIGTYPGLRTEGLLILPADTQFRGRMRAVQCRLTDPVSFALLAGGGVARFPDVGGWSAQDSARRAVAEQRAAVAAAIEPARELAALLTLARAALFLESLRAGEPELAVTVGAAAQRLAQRAPIADEALAHYREFALHRVEPPPGVVAALRDAVLNLEALDEPLRA